jgi:CRISPR-associated protein Csh1
VEIDPAVLRHYCWVGNAKGHRPQHYLITDQLRYLVGPAPVNPAPVNLLAALEVLGLSGGLLYQRLDTLIKTFYATLPGGSRVLDPARVAMAEPDFVASVWERTSGKPLERAKAVGKEAAALLRQRLLRGLGVDAADAVLWTLLFEGEPLVADSDYAALVLQDKGGTPEGAAGTATGVCSVCGAEGRTVTTDFARLDFLKYYINDKLGAASGLSEEGFARNFAACGECFRGLVVAEKYVRQHLGLRVGSLDFLVLPAFLRDPGLGRKDLETWAAKLKARVGAFANLTQWLEALGGDKGLEEELQVFLEDLPHEEVALLNFLFYRKPEGKSEFRILGLAKDIAPSRISRLLRHSHRLANWAGERLGPDRWWLDLTRIYNLIPLAEGAREAEFKRVVHIYTALLAGQPLDYGFLVRQFVALAQIFLTNNFQGTNVRPPTAGYEEVELARRLLQAGLFLKLLHEESLLEGGNFLRGHGLELEAELLPEQMRAYLTEMAYNGAQAGLFMLGYLLNQVGRAQGERGYASKPVLEKVNYNGMLWPKVMRLANLLLDQLRQHDLLRYHESLYAAMKRLLDAHREDWPLSPEENVFYILSGYAYATRQALKAWAEKQSAEGGSQS